MTKPNLSAVPSKSRAVSVDADVFNQATLKLAGARAIADLIRCASSQGTLTDLDDHTLPEAAHIIAEALGDATALLCADTKTSWTTDEQ